MASRKVRRNATTASPAFNAAAFLDSPGTGTTVARYRRGETIFAQGDDCRDVLYIQTGGVKLSMHSRTGREAIVAMLGPGDFFGEGCLAGQSVRLRTATALTPSAVLVVRKAQMVRLLRQQHAVSDQFIAQMLLRNIRIEEDLIDELFNSSEMRLARSLLRMACYGTRDTPVRIVTTLSHEKFARIVGTTCARIEFLLTRFQRLGFISCNGRRHLTINKSLLSVVLRD